MNIKIVALVLSIGLLASGSCADVNEVAPAIRIGGQVVPDDSCVVKTTGGAQQEVKSTGVLDLSLGTTYMGYLMVENAFPQFDSLVGSTPEQGLIDPSTIYVTHMDITLRTNDALILGAPDFAAKYAELHGGIGPALPLTYTVQGASSIPATGSGAVIAPLIPHNIGLAFRTLPQLLTGNAIDVVVDLRVVGQRQDGVAVQSGIFSFPIRLCNRCLIQDRYDPAIAMDPFSDENKLTDQDVGVFWQPGQDDAVTNAICGVLHKKTDIGSCHVNRCLGQAAPDGPGLLCPTDAQVFEVP